MADYEVIVLGTGGVGSAALLHAAAAGARTIGLDRFIAPHNRGSSHGQTRIIRQAYFEHPEYVPLLLESYRLWSELAEQAQKQLYFETGVLQLGPPEGVVVPGVLRAASEHRLNVEQLSAQEIETRWPALRVPAGLLGVLEPRAGYLLVEECVASHLAAAQAAGAEIEAPCEVLGWEAGMPIRVRTTNGTITTEKLIITAGAWADLLLADLKLKLEVRRKSVFWYAAKQAFNKVPCYLYELPQGVFYGFPEIGGRVKVAEHSGGERVENPLQYNREIDAYDAERIMGFLGECLPNVVDGLAEHQTCLYTMSPDEHFVLDFHPQDKNIVFAAGLSGHGFKFAPVLGKALAEMALNGGTDLAVGFLGLSRF
ncbi:MAG: N-methyl-L-tryptophan oxidase [Bythopirellula sp.]|nr:N-methyl-L-tryptophan oxidase [Bythopirellula sp.]